MDRKSNSGNRSQKKIGGHVGNEFFPLGAKSSREDSKHKTITAKPHCSMPDRKRDAVSTIGNVNKKPKLARLTDTTASHVHELWEQMAIDYECTDLLDMVATVLDKSGIESSVRIVCSLLKHFIEPFARMKFDKVLCIALMYTAKLDPNTLRHEVITAALIHILRRDSNLKFRQNSNSHILAANLLTKGYGEKKNWPELFLRIYIDDAINERVWADNEFCIPFVNNICSAFTTIIPLNSFLPVDNMNYGSVSSGQHRDVALYMEDDSGDGSVHSNDHNILLHFFDTESNMAFSVRNRFIDSEHVVKKYVVDAIKEQLNKRQQPDCFTKNLLKFLSATAGLEDVRCLCINRLELWIHNGKLVKQAQQLLSCICYNIRAQNLKDYEVLSSFLKIRLKNKPLINFYMICLKEMIVQQPDILSIILKLVIQNELSNTRNPNNMGMIATMFQTSPDQSSTYLAEIYKEFLLQREDCLRTLRVFLRELVRVLRFDMNIIQFTKVFLNGKFEFMEQVERCEFRDRIFQSMIDIVCLCMLLSVTPQIREASIPIRSTKDIKNNAMLLQFYAQMSTIQLDSISWMYETVPKFFKPQTSDYSQALYKLLLLDNPEQYSRCDQWPSEPERGTLLRIISETPIREDTLLRIILIGITKEIPFTIPDTIDIIMLVIKRASTMKIMNCPAVQTDKYDIIDFLFSMVEYHHPENIKLPADYEPPKLAITTLYWKAWLIMLMISAHNPATFGAFCWEQYPMMKQLIEMCITNQFPEQNAGKEELQILSMEREHILQFEMYLAAQTSQAVITEENAILISQLMLLDPMGPARKIPSNVLDQLKNLNKALKLGNLLCRCRKPDLLLDIIQRQGTMKSMPWLSDLVQNCEGDFGHLPVQCLCEFLLFNANTINEENTRDAELLSYLRNLLTDFNSDKKIVSEVLDYIFRRLSSTVNQCRKAAISGLRIIFKCTDMEGNVWLQKSIPQIPHFSDISSFIIPQLRAACQVENNPILIMSYIQFIAAHTIHDNVIDMLDHVIDMAQLIVERSTMFYYLIPTTYDIHSISCVDNLYEERFQTLKCLFVMFNNYIIKLREHQTPFQWSEYPDLLMVQFDDGVQLPLHLNIIHAFIILLTHSTKRMTESIPILDYWFPPGKSAPIAFLPMSPEEPVQLLPDWLKLKMIRSSVDRLIDAALYDLSPDQIVLFVQNFGTPVNSMSKLLALLDHAVNEQCDAVRNAILNKAYLAQLIEIQQLRGAKNGHFTVKALGLYSHSQTVPDLPKFNNQMQTSIMLKTDERNIIPSESVYDGNNDFDRTVDLIFKYQDLNTENVYKFRKLIHHMLERCEKPFKKNIEEDFKYINVMKRHNISIFSITPSQRSHVCTLLRALLYFKSAFKYQNITSELVYESELLLNDSFCNKDTTFYYLSLYKILKKQKKARHGVQLWNKSFAPQFWVDVYSSRKQKYNWIRNMIKCDLKKFSHNEHLCFDGLLVDYLCEIDPDLLHLNNENEFISILSNKFSDFRFYLLSHINHQTNWETVIFTLKHFIQDSEITIDYTTVLNFIEALISNPKLWQGQQDTNIQKCSTLEFQFSFTSAELKSLTEFILKEGELETGNTKMYDYKLCSRINLLLKIINRSKNNLLVFFENVINSSCVEMLKMKVLYQLYLLYPSIRFSAENFKQLSFKIQALKGCKADKIPNYLITCLGNLVLKKDFETLSSDSEMLIRKFAASHPALFLTS